MVYLDLFSGIGGFAKGLEMSGFKFRKHYYSEIDKHAIANYSYNFKNAEYVGDIRTISKRTITERPDIITFGFPCQDLSIAGKRKGLSGHRSGLFHEAVRLIKEFRPPVFIFENVKGLLSSHQGKDFELVLRTIADIGLYECEWQLLNTAWLLPQNRERIYFVGHLAGRSRPRVFPIGESDFGINERASKTTNIRAITGGGNSGGHHSGMSLIKVERTDHAGNDINQGDRVYKVSGLCPALTSSIGNNANGSVLIQQKGRGFNKGGLHKICPTLSSNAFNQNNFVKILSHYGHKNKYATMHDVCLTLKAESHGHVPMVTELRYVRTESGKQARKNAMKIGNDYTPFGNTHRQLIQSEKNVCGCLTNGTNKDTLIGNDNQIRRLTETECERLQGFPDDWTMYGNYDGVIKKISKTQRYKMLGNAVSTVVVQLVGNKLMQS